MFPPPRLDRLLLLPTVATRVASLLLRRSRLLHRRSSRIFCHRHHLLFQRFGEAVADRTWLKLKQFSLLTVREGLHGERTGCLHRLLGQSLRVHMSPRRAAFVLASSVWKEMYY